MMSPTTTLTTTLNDLTLTLALAVPLLLALVLTASGLFRNIAAARATGLPYVVVPVHITSIPWLLLQHLCVPVLERVLPARWAEAWLP